MKYAIIENGKVVNIAVSDSALGSNWIPALSSSVGDLWDGDTFHSPTKSREDLLSELSAYRYEREVGGTTFNGMTVRTDRATRASITEAQNALSSGLITEPISWKMENGWVELTQELLNGIASAVASHVQNCFLAEKVVSYAIRDASDKELLSLDVVVSFETHMP